MSEKPKGIPETQYAVQLIGPSKLKLNKAKPVTPPGPTQVLARIEAVGLCFSDLKLLKQFAKHARKGEILTGIDPAVLEQEMIYGGGGDDSVLLRMRAADLLSAAAAQVVSVCE